MRTLAREVGATVMPCDVERPDALAALAAANADAGIVIMNAGLEAPDDLCALAPDEIRQIVAVNLTAPAVIAAAIAPHMIQRGRGQIVFVSSIAGKVATAGNGTLYTATKWGVRGLGLALREELNGTGVGVSTVFPGPISDAGMFARAHVTLPRGIRTRTPGQVASAIIRAIELNQAEIDVADPVTRLGGRLGALLPAAVTTEIFSRPVDERVSGDLRSCGFGLGV